MKTSFYFVLWIVIYPILGLFHNDFIDRSAFILALVIVWGVSLLLNRVMPRTMIYERFSRDVPILEDVYTCNVASFSKRLSRDAIVETIVAVYYTVSLTYIAIIFFKSGFNGWLILALFASFAYETVKRSVRFIRAKPKLRRNPTPEMCVEITSDVYDLNYAAYYEDRNGLSFADIMPPKPRRFKAFRIFSAVMAAIATLFGLSNICYAVVAIASSPAFVTDTICIMLFLYGSLSAYFGVKDFISCLQYGKSITPVPSTQPE